jgi:hypothetical protein
MQAASRRRDYDSSARSFCPCCIIYKYEKSYTFSPSPAGFFHATRASSSSYKLLYCDAWAERGLYLSVLSACSQLTGPTRKWCSKRRPWIETLTLRVARSWVSLELAHSAHRALRARTVGAAAAAALTGIRRALPKPDAAGRSPA